MTELRRLKPPDMQALVDRFGTYPAITPEAWAEYRSTLEAWRALHRRPQGAVLDDDPVARDYARQTGQEAGHDPRPDDPARHADFAVYPDSDGNIGTKEIEDALRRTGQKKRKSDDD